MDEVCCWLTGYTPEQIARQIAKGVSYRTFFDEAPQMNANSHLIAGSICGIRVESIEDPLMQKIRWLDKLVDVHEAFAWLERLCIFDIHNHYDIHPEWQDLKVGDFQFFHQPPLTIGEWVTEVSNDGPWYFAAHSDTAVDPGYKNPGPNQEKALCEDRFEYADSKR